MKNGLKLLKIKETDLEKVITWRMLPRVTKYMFTDPVLTMQKQMQWFERIQEAKDCIYWIAYYDDKPIGVVGITEIENEHGNLGWYIGEDGYVGKGLGQELLSGTLEFLFKKNIVTRVISQVFAENVAAIRVYQKLGFREDARKEKQVDKYGKTHKVRWFEIDKCDWHQEKITNAGEMVYIEE